MDAIILTPFTSKLLQCIITAFSLEISMSDLGNLHHFLRITTIRDQHNLFLSQANYAHEVLKTAFMASCKPCTTPMDASAKLNVIVGDPLPKGTVYHTLAGALQYLTFTFPNITYVIQWVCLFMHAPREPHLQFMKRLL